MNTFKERFAQFLEQPDREILRELLTSNFGETNNMDFKKEIPEPPKLAKHLIALANSGGGCIILGVDEISKVELNVCGIEKILDKTDIIASVKKYLPSEIKWDILNINYNSADYPKFQGKSFQVIVVQDDIEHLPYSSLVSSGQDIIANRIYIRRGVSSTEVNYEELQKLLNKRIESGYSSTKEIMLEEHLIQLKILYSNISKNVSENSIFGNLGLHISLQLGNKISPNKSYPEEDFEQFIARMIEFKKKKIQSIL